MIIELLKELFTLLSMVVEVYIMLKFACVIGKMKYKIGFASVILGVLILLLTDITFPFLKQIILLLIMTLYLKLKENRKFINVLLFVLMGILYLLILEVFTCMIYNGLFKIHIVNYNLFKREVLLIPTRIIQIFIITILNKYKEKIL